MLISEIGDKVIYSPIFIFWLISGVNIGLAEEKVSYEGRFLRADHQMWGLLRSGGQQSRATMSRLKTHSGEGQNNERVAAGLVLVINIKWITQELLLTEWEQPRINNPLIVGCLQRTIAGIQANKQTQLIKVAATCLQKRNLSANFRVRHQSAQS